MQEEEKSKKISSKQAIAVVIFLLSITVTTLIYMPGTGGTWHFDDAATLTDLQWVTDTNSMLAFIGDGQAGPLGRPLALLSFALQGHAWPHSPEILLYTNILLHVLNGALVTWLFYLIGNARGAKPREAALTAAVGGSAWMLLPILASTSLLVVQRMTLLSATFLLLGFISYLYSRRLLATRQRLALSGMSASIVFFSILATLSKENGAILPALVLVVELTLLAKPDSLPPPQWRRWLFVFLLLPTLLILGYLVSMLPYGDGMILIRGWSGGERLLTQAHILWEYLYHAFLPHSANLSPFQDDRTAHETWMNSAVLLSIIGWVVTFVVAFLLRSKTRLPIFALFWYLAGHLIESSTVPLELYYEHRNYIPLAGPVYALIVGILTVKRPYMIAARAGVAGYLFLLATILYENTTLWGQPSLAAEMWAIHKPNSSRATQFLAQRLENDGYHSAAKRVLEEFSENKNAPSHMAAIQNLMLSCISGSDDDLQAKHQALHNELANTPFQPAIIQSLNVLYESILSGDCNKLSSDSVYMLAQHVAANPAYQAHAISYHNVQLLLAKISFEKRDLNQTMSHLESAMERHYSFTTLSLAVEVLKSAGLNEAAEEFIRKAYKTPPKYPLRRLIWKNRLDSLMATVSSAKK